MGRRDIGTVRSHVSSNGTRRYLRFRAHGAGWQIPLGAVTLEAAEREPRHVHADGERGMPIGATLRAFRPQPQWVER
jgi:hypothetical protein